MAGSIDSSEGAHTLPRPELNPLLNPLLAENMGRWAEVYFTSPPEKREEAVLELLRELEARNSEPVASTSQAAPAMPRDIAAASRDHRVARSSQEDEQHCETCGHDNPPRHQFCGMCGSQLGGVAPKPFKLNEISDPDEAENELVEPAAYEQSGADFREAIEEEPFTPADDSPRNPYDLFQTLRRNEFTTANVNYEESPSVRYRSYIAAVLAILILVLGYLAWSGSRANPSAQGAPPPPPPATAESTAAPANPNAESAVSSAPKTTEPKAAVPATATAAEERAVKPTEAAKSTGAAPNAEHRPTATPAPASVPSPPAAANVGLPTWAGNGSEEFAMAQHYLTGQPRNSAEAAKWLWKAMAKHNGPAMVALADLYLKGDGVSKSCDQARVLLDSAAQRGVAGAGQRLRSLQAFACQ